MFTQLADINRRPAPFDHCSAESLWTDEHISSRMLAHHLDGASDTASRNAAFIGRSAAWIVEKFDLGPGRSVLDLGCGPGLYAMPFARAGAHVTGIDFSARSIAYARQQASLDGLAADFVCGNYLDHRPSRRVDLVTMITCDFCALSPDQRKRLLAIVRACLEPGGAFLFDVYSLRAFENRREQATYAPNLMDGFWSPEPYFGFLSSFKYEAERVALDKFTIVEASRTRVVHNWFQHFDVESLTRELDESGLRVDEVLGDVAGAAIDKSGSEFAVVARLLHPAGSWDTVGASA